MPDVGPFALAYRLLRDLVSWAGRRRRPTPEEIVSGRTRWKSEFERNLRWIDSSLGYGEAIVRDVRRADSYPDVEEGGRGISPWFRVGIVGLYHRGVEVGLHYTGVHLDPRSEKLRLTEVTREQSDYSLLVLGRIPFERIVSVDWSGDEYYCSPHIYCRFDSPQREPYEDMVLAEKVETPERYYFREVEKYMPVHKASRRWARFRCWRAT